MNNWKKFKLFFKMSWKISPSYLFLLAFNSFASSGQIFANIILPKFLIDEIVTTKDAKRLLIYALLIIGSNLFFAWFNQLMKQIMNVRNKYMNQKMEELLGEKIMNLEYSNLEDPYYLDLKERAVFAASNQSSMYHLILGITTLLKNGVTLFGIVLILLTLSPLFVLVLITIIGIMLLIQKNFMTYQKEFFNEIIPINRKYGYYVGLGFSDEIAKDIRLYQMSEMLSDKTIWMNTEIANWFTRYYEKRGLNMGLYGIFNDLQSALAYGFVGLRVITDWFGPKISLGSFSMYVSSTINFSTNVMELGTSVLNVIQMLGYLDPFMELMSLPNEAEQKGIPFVGPIESIKFDHITFRYTKGSAMVLNDINFEIKKGEKISIVGLNGAGKTTLIKLLCRLYKPESGTIFINNRNIYEYDYTSYMKEVAAVFQDYKLFAFSIEENITCDPLGNKTDEAIQLAKEVDLWDKIQTLPNGIASLFGKAYDEEGIQMSGGQSQKIAIARALHKKASLIILDEPTSALDPLAEAEIYNNFNQLVGDKTAVYISHRMSSSVFCDKILVLDGGKISDYAPHTELMQKSDSLYYKLFKSQAENYQI